MSKAAKVTRWFVRVLLLVLSILFACGGPIPEWMTHLFPSLSPLAAVTSTIAHRGWYRAIYWVLPPLCVLIFAVFRGRIFCRWICPAGTLYSAASRFSVKKKVFSFNVGPYLFWGTMAGAMLGVPLFLFTDPLAAANRCFVVLCEFRLTWAKIPGLLVPLFIVLSFIQPMVWCTCFCPLGYLFDIVCIKSQPVSQRFRQDRRQIVAGLVTGVPFALLASSIPLWPSLKKKWPVLPPGALDAHDFAERCSRCYACVNACPTDVLQVHFAMERSLMQFCQPEMNANVGVCDEYCNQCSRVCHTGAIQHITEDEKRYRKIGTAVIKREACLAWTDDQYCMVCDEFCPYNAIDTDEDKHGLARPVVNVAQCRGCGMCQNNCPAIRDGLAIIVEGVAAQSLIAKNDLYDI